MIEMSANATVIIIYFETYECIKPSHSLYILNVYNAIAQPYLNKF